MKVPFSISTSAARNVKANGELLVNMYADQLPPNAKSQVALIGTPGWTYRLSLATAPIIGMHYFNGNLYVVTQTHLYKVASDDTITTVGTLDLSATDQASIADNGVNMVIVGGNGYYSDGSTVTKITHAAYYPSDTVIFKDGYFIFNRSNTNQFFISKLYSVDFDATMYASAEGSPDNIVGIATDSRNVWIFGTQSTEVWYNSGDSLFPFDRVSGSFSQRGCLSYKTISSINNTICWVADDGMVYMANGYTPQQISTPAVEYQIAKRGTKSMRAFSYTEEGHYFYVLTIDSQITLVYDMKTALWHTRASNSSTWGLNNIIRSDTGLLMGSDYTTGILYYVGLDYYTENGQIICREAVTSPLLPDVDFHSIHKFELDMETGKSVVNETDTVCLQFSSDGGVSFGNEHTISLGDQGKRKTRIVWRRLGRHRNFSAKVKFRSASQINIIAAYAEME